MPEAPAPAGTPRRRNILFITTDQQRYDSLGCNGGTVARTPVVDRLAADKASPTGVPTTRTRCACRRARCTPTGQYVRTHGVVANGIPLPLDAPSVAQYLADAAGYRTALLGKAHFEPGFDPQNQFEENARVGVGRHRAVARVRAVAASHARGGVGRSCDRGLRPLAKGASSRTPAQLRRIAPGRARRRHTGTRDQEQPHPTCVVPHRLGRRPDRRLAAVTRRRRAVVLLDVLPRPASPADPPASELHRVPWQELGLPPGHPGSDDGIRAVLERKPAHWLAFWDGRFPNMEGGPAALSPRDSPTTRSARSTPRCTS